MAGLSRNIFFVEVKETGVRESKSLLSFFLQIRPSATLILHLSYSLQVERLKLLFVLFVLLPHLASIPPQPVTSLAFAS